MQKHENRDMLVLATKFTTGYPNYRLGKGKTVNYTGNHKKSLHMSVRDSLKKLQTDYIEYATLHTPPNHTNKIFTASSTFIGGTGPPPSKN